MEKETLWLIPARSGSKGIINKNIRLLNGIPLLAYRIKTALSISDKKNVWVTTDSKDYAEIAKSYGACVPFLRPDYLSSDNASSMDVVLHAMQYANGIGQKFDFIGLLEPTSPFVYYLDILNAVKKLDVNSDSKAIVAVKETRPNTFFIQEESDFLSEISNRIKTISTFGRQQFNKEITPSGGFYISKWEDFLIENNFYTEKTIPYLLDDISSLEIDEPIDWQWAEFILEKKLINIESVFK